MGKTLKKLTLGGPAMSPLILSKTKLLHFSVSKDVHVSTCYMCNYICFENLKIK